LLLGETRRRRLAEHVRSAAGRWRSAWAAEPHSSLQAEAHGSYRASPASSWGDTVCYRVGTEPTPELAVLWEVRNLPWFAGLTGMGTDHLENPLSRSSLVAAIVAESMRGLAVELLGSRVPAGEAVTVTRMSEAGGDAVHVLKASRHPGVVVTLEASRVAMLVLLAPRLVASILPAGGSARLAEPVERRLAAAAEQTLSVEQVLGHAQISLADLARLRIGDVIVLEESLSKGGELFLAGGGQLGTTRPGRAEHKRAVQLQVIQSKGRSR
jgi:hypothetical protein